MASVTHKMSVLSEKDGMPMPEQAKDDELLLNIIDQLRAEGLGSYIGLPQIIVTGDQSSGKSSVLQAVSGLRFPVKDNVCTQFATELGLRRAEQEKFSITIIPDPDRCEEEKIQLSNFCVSDGRIAELDILTEKAKDAMGLNSGRRTFSKDVLKVEFMGPTQPNLTLVDLPGLIHAENEENSSGDIEIVRSLNFDYMKNTRSVILAVVSAKSDYANQAITTLAREVDPERLRTLGIITKPDILDADSNSERVYSELVRTEAARGFRLGWHALKNRDFKQKDCSDAIRDQEERKFFSEGIWSNIPRERLGKENLRSRLSIVLKNQIVSQLPSLAKEVELGILQCKEKLSRLGNERATTQEQRVYLLQIGEKFRHLMKEAVDGTYNDAFFGNPMRDIEYHKRLRAVIQNESIQFAQNMRNNGYDRKISESGKTARRITSGESFAEDVQVLMKRSRGRELPGTYNPLVIGDVFLQQSKPWKHMVEQFCERIMLVVSHCLATILGHISDVKTVNGLSYHVVHPQLEKCRTMVDEKVTELLRPHREGHPMTYNHYFTDTVQSARKEHQKLTLKRALHDLCGKNMDDSTFIVNGVLSQTLLDTMTETRERDMDRYAADEVVHCAQAYHKVAMKLLVDNIAMLAIEDQVMKQLPFIFSAEAIMKIGVEKLSDIAGESQESKFERDRTQSKLTVLEKALLILQRLDHQDTQSRSMRMSLINTTYEQGTDDVMSGSSNDSEHEEPAEENVTVDTASWGDWSISRASNKGTVPSNTPKAKKHGKMKNGVIW